MPRPEPRTLAPGPDGRFDGLEPETWAMEVGFLLDQVHHNPVGRAVVESVMRRTTIYSTVGRPHPRLRSMPRRSAPTR